MVYVIEEKVSICPATACETAQFSTSLHMHRFSLNQWHQKQKIYLTKMLLKELISLIT